MLFYIKFANDIHVVCCIFLLFIIMIELLNCIPEGSSFSLVAKAVTLYFHKMSSNVTCSEVEAGRISHFKGPNPLLKAADCMLA